MPEAEYIARVKLLLPTAEGELQTGALEKCLQDALLRYSRLSPRLAVSEYTGDGSTYDFALPADWVEGFSRIVAIEYPAGEQTPQYLDPRLYDLYLDPTAGTVLRFLAYAPAEAKRFRLFYTKPHEIDATTDTTSPEDFEAICFLTASIVCLNLAGKYSGFYEPTLEADLIRYRTKADDYRSLAAEFEALFQSHFGMKRREVAPASLAWLDLDLPLVGLEIGPVLRKR